MCEVIKLDSPFNTNYMCEVIKLDFPFNTNYVSSDQIRLSL
jgi:hypothetical protein